MNGGQFAAITAVSLVGFLSILALVILAIVIAA